MDAFVLEVFDRSAPKGVGHAKLAGKGAVSVFVCLLLFVSILIMPAFCQATTQYAISEWVERAPPADGASPLPPQPTFKHTLAAKKAGQQEFYYHLNR